MYYRKYYTLGILHVFSYYVHSVEFCIFEFPVDA